jgi:hypothetical protein
MSRGRTRGSSCQAVRIGQGVLSLGTLQLARKSGYTYVHVDFEVCNHLICTKLYILLCKIKVAIAVCVSHQLEYLYRLLQLALETTPSHARIHKSKYNAGTCPGR